MYKQIGQEELPAYLLLKGLIIVDVRDRASFEAEHIAGARHLSISGLNTFYQSTALDTPVLLYCYHGISSQAVAQCLVDKGFKHVYSLIGGFESWKLWKSRDTTGSHLS